MKLFLEEGTFIETEKSIDISIPIDMNKGAKAWYVDAPTFEPVRANGFLGSVEEGGNVNFRNVFFNPHGHGTHTECVGHISKERLSVNQSLKDTFFKAQLVSCELKSMRNEYYKEDDLVIDADQFEGIEKGLEAIIIRTLPNDIEKLTKNYSGTNSPYLTEAAIQKIVELKIQHLLIDLPSVDRETDEGVLNAHHIFWNYPAEINLDKTITELIYVPNEVEDGTYILNIQMASFENDASPSKPVLYRIHSS
jgi:kynurenine formamidase